MREFTAGFLFCGLGAGALGFIEAVGQLGEDRARFRNLGGIDNDPLACADFEYLTGGSATCADVSAITPAELVDRWGAATPDCVFLSPPCKGFSGLLSNAASVAPKYLALNRLVLQGLFLLCETYDPAPTLIVLENVPRIQSRGRELLDHVRQLLTEYGYVFHEATHDCGEIGELGQHRRRYLLVARRPAALKAYVYRPPRKRVKACGEILDKLPLPQDDSAGELHELPRISWLNWVRLALIPAGGDWRDLPRATPIEHGNADRTRGGALGVLDWKEPARTVTATMRVQGSNTPGSVADPRLSSPVPPDAARRSIWPRYDVRPWTEPARTVAGDGSNAGFGVADPRVEPCFRGSFGVTGWDEPAPTVRGAANVRTAPAAVADPRIAMQKHPDAHHNIMRVVPWEEPSLTVIGATRPGSGGACVADPRVAEAVAVKCDSRPNLFGVNEWTEPMKSVTGSVAVASSNGVAAVADPRVDEVAPASARRAGAYGVLSWQEAAGTVTGEAGVPNGRFAVADPRKSPDFTPVIVSEDGTWHRPLTTLELAALQGIPARMNGAPLRLAGRSIAKWRERIGNAVPVGAARAIAETLLKALLAGSLGTWFLSSDGIWVRQTDGLTEDDQLEASA